MTEEYDKALAKYYSKLRIVPLPLISWDIFVSQNIEVSNYNSIQKNWKVKEDFRMIVYQQKREIIITNSNQEIIFATKGIYNMNGYLPYEVIGKYPKIFQGEQTSEETKANIREAIYSQASFKETLLNYKKDGTTYLCEIEAFPKFNKKGELINYIAFEKIAS